MRLSTKLLMLLSLTALLISSIAISTPRGGCEDCLIPRILFTFVALLGIVAALRPDLCLHRRVSDDPSRVSTLLGLRLIHGYHPLCDGFRGHEIWVGDKTLCAGCLGLVVGILISLAFIVLGSNPLSAFPLSGLILVSIGLLHPLIRGRPPHLRLLLNAILPVGFALTLLSACGVGGLTLGLLALGFSLLWMITRVELSRWEHEVVCLNCGEPCPFRVGLPPHSEGFEYDVYAEEDDEDGPDISPGQPWDVGFQQPDEACEDDEEAEDETPEGSALGAEA